MTERLQIRFEYNAIEDRLLLRISGKKNEDSCVEYRLWLTRRFTGIFSKAMDKLIEDELAADINLSPDAVDAMKTFQKEAALSKADFSTSYTADSENCKVFSEQPLLVITLKIKKRSKGVYLFSLLDDENKGVHLTTAMDLVHTLQKMLVDASASAGWNIPLLQTKGENSPKGNTSGYIS